MKKIVFLLLIAAAGLAAAKNPAVKEDKSLQRWWEKTFIPMLEKQNVDKIVSLTTFPFYVYEGEEKKHIIDETFYRSIAKVLFNQAFIDKFKNLKVKSLPFDGTVYRIKFGTGEASQNFIEIFSLSGCFTYMFKPSGDGKSLIFEGIEINLPCE